MTLDIDRWLHEIGLAQYAGLFRDNDIDGDLLGQLTGEDLKDIGIGSLGHRKRLLEAIAALARSREADDAPKQIPSINQPREAERRQLTVMFVDLVNSTGLSQRLDPEEMRDVIRAYQNAVAGEIGRLDGFVAKLMGDGVLAYFGWPRAHEDEAERAVRAGLSVISAVSRLPPAGGEAMAARVGIATGLVVVGDLAGDGAAQEQAVIGDTPNLAARLQSVAEPGMVVVAEATRNLLGNLFELHALGGQKLKGIPEPVPVFSVLGERAVESRFAARRAGSVSPIVGRDQELALLLDRWRRASEGEGQVILLSGEAGIGKSRLTEALVETVSNDAHFLVRYQCSPYHADSALYPVIQQMHHGAGIITGDDTELNLNRLEALLAKSTDKIDDVAPLIATLVGLDGERRYGALTLTPQQRRNRTLAVIVDQVGGLAAIKPLLWVIEDAHWIDPTTLELIELALDRIQGTRVLLLITTRPTFTGSFGGHPVVTRLALNRLARAATQAIVARITDGKELPPILLDEIAARTDGVPLFVEEMTKAVLESGILKEGPGAYQLDGALDALKIPTTLHDSLMARLDRLQPVKELAQTASVIGRNFDHRTIAALSAMSELELASGMHRLMEAELVFRRGTPPEATYLFKHALVRDAAYESLLKAKRTQLHARLLGVLESGGHAAPEIMAQHAESANLLNQAIDYWEEAGKRAIARPAYKEAIASFDNAIRICRAIGAGELSKRRELDLQLQLGQALIANQGYQAAQTLQAFERALTLSEETGELSLQLQALYGKWASNYIAGVRSNDPAQRFAALAEELPETGPRLVGLRMLALEQFHLGHFKEARLVVGQSLSSYDPVKHRDLKLRFGHDPRTAATIYDAWSLWHLGWPDKAARTIEDNVHWTRQLNHANTLGIALCFGFATVNIWLRRADRVEMAAREALRLAEDNSMALWHAWALTQFGWAQSQLDAARGIEEMEAGLRESLLIGAHRFEPFHRSLVAEAYARTGRHERAKAHIAKAFEAMAQNHDAAFSAELYRVRATLAIRANGSDLDAVEADLRQALEIARRQDALSLQLRAARDLASWLASRGEKRQAADLLAPIFGRFSEGFDTLDLKEARALLAEIGE